MREIIVELNEDSYFWSMCLTYVLWSEHFVKKNCFKKRQKFTTTQVFLLCNPWKNRLLLAVFVKQVYWKEMLMFQLITMAEDIKLCSKCKPGKPEGKLSTTSLVYVPAQMKVSVCGSLYNCHCGKPYARLIQQLEYVRYKTVSLMIYLLFHFYVCCIWYFRCGLFYHGACYNVEDCILVSTLEKGKHVYLPWSLL